MFNVTFLNMMRLYSENRVLEKEKAVQDTIIDLYGEQTGVYRNTIPRMKENFKIQKELNQDCIPKLNECSKSLDIYRPRARRRGWLLLGGIPLSIGVGFATGVIYQSLK